MFYVSILRFIILISIILMSYSLVSPDEILNSKSGFTGFNLSLCRQIATLILKYKKYNKDKIHDQYSEAIYVYVNIKDEHEEITVNSWFYVTLRLVYRSKFIVMTNDSWWDSKKKQWIFIYPKKIEDRMLCYMPLVYSSNTDVHIINEDTKHTENNFTINENPKIINFSNMEFYLQIKKTKMKEILDETGVSYSIISHKDHKNSHLTYRSIDLGEYNDKTPLLINKK